MKRVIHLSLFLMIPFLGVTQTPKTGISLDLSPRISYRSISDLSMQKSLKYATDEDKPGLDMGIGVSFTREIAQTPWSWSTRFNINEMRYTSRADSVQIILGADRTEQRGMHSKFRYSAIGTGGKMIYGKSDWYFSAGLDYQYVWQRRYENTIDEVEHSNSIHLFDSSLQRHQIVPHVGVARNFKITEGFAFRATWEAGYFLTSVITEVKNRLYYTSFGVSIDLYSNQK